MAEINRNEITAEMVVKAVKCKTAEELMKLAESEGFEMTKEEAEAYLEELSDFEVDEETLKAAAGGMTTCYMVDGCAFKCSTLKDC